MEAGKNGITSGELREKLGRRYEKNLVEAAIYDELERSELFYSHKAESPRVRYWYDKPPFRDFSKSTIDLFCEEHKNDLTSWLG
jgi:hypothetical protein